MQVIQATPEEAKLFGTWIGERVERAALGCPKQNIPPKWCPELSAWVKAIDHHAMQHWTEPPIPIGLAYVVQAAADAFGVDPLGDDAAKFLSASYGFGIAASRLGKFQGWHQLSAAPVARTEMKRLLEIVGARLEECT